MPSQHRTRYSRFGLFFLLCSLLACAATAARAQNDEAPPYDPFAQAAIMHVGFINTDCVRDTVYGFLDPDLRWTPRFICWGYPFDRQGHSLCDQGQRNGSANDAREGRTHPLDTTRISFPDWTTLSCAFSVQRYNANDTLDDLIFWLHGTDSVQEGVIDTSRSLVLFGQRGLDTLTSIDLSGVGAFRSAPFYAMELTRGRELVNAKRRDMTRKPSRELVRVDRNVLEEEQRDTANAPAPQVLSGVAGDPVFSARIYPNPAIYTTNVEIRPLPPGSYSVDIVAVNGDEAWRGNAVLTQSGQIFQTVDLSGLAAGYYIVRIHAAEKIIGTYPIVVVR